MRIISLNKLKSFWNTHKETEEPLKAWYYEVKKADWVKSLDIKEKYGSASILKNNRVVFNIKGNKYRLVVKIQYEMKIVYIKFIGTHQEYDRINVEEIE
ncbi:type II toxin-antitoxin system HigB family toxin [Acidobacteriota bacterium]